MHSGTFHYSLSSLIALGLGIAVAGCGDDSPSPVAPADGQLTAAATAAPAFTQLSAGGNHTCGITGAGKAYCWGSNEWGQLGDASTVGPRATPVAVAGNLQFRQISAGGLHTCGVTTEFRLYCWGDNTSGELGTGFPVGEIVPKPVASTLHFRTVDAGSGHTCALTNPDRRAYCWGRNTEGQVGDGSLANRPLPTAVAGGREFKQVTAGFAFSCGVTPANEAYCWGTDAGGRIGDGSTRLDRPTPTLVAGGHAFTQIDAGIASACAVTTGHKAYCWGSGGIGDGGNVARYTPSAVAGGLSLARVTVGFLDACAESTTGKAYCWGQNTSGEVGDGTSTQRLKPVPVVGGHVFAQLTAGDHYACGRTTASASYCWGRDDDGQLGDGHVGIDDKPVPTLVVGSN
jgi:alpha-tubulin suppressor-like RCC1 family protein